MDMLNVDNLRLFGWELSSNTWSRNVGKKKHSTNLEIWRWRRVRKKLQLSNTGNWIPYPLVYDDHCQTISKARIPSAVGLLPNTNDTNLYAPWSTLHTQIFRWSILASMVKPEVSDGVWVRVSVINNAIYLHKDIGTVEVGPKQCIQSKTMNIRNEGGK